MGIFLTLYPEIMYTDLSYLRQITRNNYEIINITIGKFLTNIPEASQKMKAALRSEDWDTIGSEAHKLLSSIGILQIKKMEGLVRRLESNCKDREHLGEVPKMVDEVKEISCYVVKELEEIKIDLERDPTVVISKKAD